MSGSVVLDAAGRRRSPATLPGHHAGRVPSNKGQRYPADPPTVEEIITVMRQTRDERRGSLLVRSGTGGRRREIGMDSWGWEQLRPWLGARADLPVGPRISSATPTQSNPPARA